MWPPDFLMKRKRDVLRIGRERVEYWAWESGGLVLRCHQMLSAEPGAGALLEPELRAWLPTLGSDASTKPVHVVLESAWLPVMLIEVGRTLWSRGQVENLLRHRLAQLYAHPNESVDGWQLQLDYRAGDAQALGYGLSPSIRQALLGAVAAAGPRAASLQPAFAWGWQRLERRRRSLRTGWWTWIEQDRALVCRIKRGRITSMNAGAAMPGDDEQAARLVAIEAARLGILEPAGGAITASWQDLSAPSAETPAPRPPLRSEATT